MAKQNKPRFNPALWIKKIAEQITGVEYKDSRKAAEVVETGLENFATSLITTHVIAVVYNQTTVTRLAADPGSLDTLVGIENLKRALEDVSKLLEERKRVLLDGMAQAVKEERPEEE